MSISSFDLNLLVVLDTVLAERSVVRAARRLHVTPSAVSNALARLRELLGDPLVSRSGRGIVPTPRALQLAPAISRALGDLDRAVNGEAFDPMSSIRRFTVALTDAGQIEHLARLAERFAAEMPRASLRVVGIDRLHIAGGLAGTEVDVAIARGMKGPGIHMMPLYEERMVLVMRHDHPSARRRLTKAALGALRHVDVHVAHDQSIRDIVVNYARLRIDRDVAVVVPTFAAAAAAVATSDLVATLPEGVVNVLGKGLRIRPVTTPMPPITFALHLVWHERTHRDPAMRAFRDIVARVERPRPHGSLPKRKDPASDT